MVNSLTMRLTKVKNTATAISYAAITFGVLAIISTGGLVGYIIWRLLGCP